MMSDTAMRSMLRNSDYGDELGRELGALHREEELNIYRSGSAPPTVEGSLSAVGGLFRKESPAFGFYEGGDCGGKGFMRDEELRSDPAYVSYYYSNVNLNPRLPPPLISREEVRFAQRFQGVGTGSALGGIGDRGKVSNGGITNSSSLFSMHKEQNGVESRNAAEWGGNGLIGLPGLGLGSRQKSIPEIIQDDLSRVKSISRHPSRPASRNAYDDEVETSKSLFSQLHYESSSIDALRSGANTPGISPAQNIGSLAAQTYASALGASLSRSTTPDPKSLPRAPSPRIPPVGGGRSSSTNTRNINVPNSFSGVAAGMSESADLVAALSGMNLSTDGQIHEENHSRSKVNDVDDHQSLFNLQNDQNQLKQDSYFNKAGSGSSDNLFLKGISVPALHTSSGMNLSTDGQIHEENHSRSKVDDVDDHQNLFNLQNDQNQLKQDSYFNKAGSGLSDNLFLKRISVPALSNGRTSPSHYQNTDFTYSSVPNHGLNGYAINPPSPSMMGNQLGNGNLPLLFENAAAASAMGVPAMDSRALGWDLASGPNFVSAAVELQNLSGVGNHPMDPLYLQYLRSTEYAAPRVGALNEPTVDREYMSSLYTDLLQKAYLGTLLSPQKSQYGAPYFGKSASLNHNYYGDPALGLGMSYQGSPLGGPLLPSSPIGYGSPVRRGERNLRFPSGIRNLDGGVMGAWDPEAGANFHENFASSLLDEFKSNKTRCFELSEIAGHVVEFSTDQYGSRFIQQKLENATAEERDMVFHEIMPHTLSLMTDVFGNYVIQKFFEHGTAFQIRELADQLNGHVLTLSLQMYGCRVIQKAIEVVELDQQTKMVAELDGHVMRCVRDQNGNHVIQKCIECIPEDAIQFIISTFYNQVVTLSTHPYGCRVIQRVLEHCSDLKTQGLMMDEILDNACMLAQDQYGNYVVQHVLEHGKPHERSVIIKKLSGQIVQMSQQKFASNVVEKCLAFGDPVERQTLVNEMLGCTDENEPLQAMMKDQFANYVVQKVLETCDDQHLELILNRIKVHLNALKKYTYGKHIVARVEKLVTAAERRISVLCPNPAA